MEENPEPRTSMPGGMPGKGLTTPAATARLLGRAGIRTGVLLGRVAPTRSHR